MSRVAARLARVAAAVPPPRPPAQDYDLSRLTPDQLARMGVLRGRIDAVGLSGITDDELEELATISEILTAPDPSEGAAP